MEFDQQSGNFTFDQHDHAMLGIEWEVVPAEQSEKIIKAVAELQRHAENYDLSVIPWGPARQIKQKMLHEEQQYAHGILRQLAVNGIFKINFGDSDETPKP